MVNNFGDEIPDKLYKYMSWPVEGINYTKELIENNAFYLNPVSQMNDPFDEGVEVDFKCNKKTFLLEAQKSLRMNEKEKDALCDGIRHDTKFTNISPYLASHSLINRMKNFVGITCFSQNGIKDPNNILMWSHYTEKHSGICLVFNTDDLLQRVHRITYVKEYPILNYYELIENNQTDKIYTIKYAVWEYEGEYRIIGRAKGKVRFMENSLKEIYMGCRFKDVDMLKELLSKRKYPIKLYKTVKDGKKFRLKKIYIGTYGG
jgi:hypothetical protein